MFSRTGWDNPLARVVLAAQHDLATSRRGLLLAPLLAALPLVHSDSGAHAGKLDPSETAITLPDAIKWDTWRAGTVPMIGETLLMGRHGRLDSAEPSVGETLK
jgi:hypothetical protein